MFKRRPRSYGRQAAEMFYPRGGWSRAAQYLLLRIRRLPDPPHRVARGVALGVFVSFTPFLGLHLVLAMGLAWLFGANVFAAVIGSLVGNPLTIPVIALASVRLGRWMLGVPGSSNPAALIDSFARASAQLTHNLFAMLRGGEVEWSKLAHFWDTIFVPYAVGCILPGLAAAAVAHVLTVPLVETYHRRRAARRSGRSGPAARGPDGAAPAVEAAGVAAPLTAAAEPLSPTPSAPSTAVPQPPSAPPGPGRPPADRG